jgi:hypothetical protein
VDHVALQQSCTWKKQMEEFRKFLKTLFFGEIKQGKPLPDHVLNLKLNSDLIMVHMINAENPKPLPKGYRFD